MLGPALETVPKGLYIHAPQWPHRFHRNLALLNSFSLSLTEKCLLKTSWENVSYPKIEIIIGAIFSVIRESIYDRPV